MHNYIDVSKLYDFSVDKTFDDIYDDIKNKYKLTNIEEDEFCDEYRCIICSSLYLDYKNKMANYEAYIEEGMNARMFLNLRKSALVPLEEDLFDFYTDHCKCDTIEEVVSHRINFLKRFNSDYIDLNWQYFFLIKYTQGYKSKDFIFDFEECYADGNWRLQTNPDMYLREFKNAHLPDRLQY